MSWDGYNTSIAANRFQKAFVIDYVDLSGRLVVSNGDASLNNRLFVMNDASFMSNVYVDDLLTSNLKFVANGDASLNNRLFVMNDVSFTSNVYIGIKLGIGTTAPSGLLDISGSSVRTTIITNGNVGIGTTAPSGLLDISGSSVRTTIITNGNIGIRTTAPAGLLDISGSSVRTTIITNGNIGIGTTAPSGLLDISGSSVRTTIITNGNIGIGTTAPAGLLDISSGNLARMTVLNTGYVGIGTSNPLDFLHIYGNASTAAANAPDGNYNHNLCLTSTKGGSTPYSMALGVDYASGFGYINAAGNSLYQPICLQTRGGNVGIATTAPVGLFDVSGIAVRTTIIANGNVGIATTTPAGLLDINGSSVRTTIIANGNVGIGTTAPTVPLHVVTTGTIAAGSSRYFTSSATQLSASAAGGTPAAGIYSTGSIISTVGFYASSDIRIKKNIMDATDLSCSYILQYLKPKIFNFIDTKQNNIEPTWGFIAQEVKEIIPNAISYIKEYITNIYESADLSGNMITLRNKTTADLLKDEAGYNKLKIFNTDEKEKIVTIKEIIDEKRFIIESEEPIETENNIVFIYGQEVPDFHSLDKDMIFTLTTAVVKEIDNDLRITKERVKILEEENATLKQELKYVIKRLENAGF